MHIKKKNLWLPNIVSIWVIKFFVEVDNGGLRSQRDASGKDHGEATIAGIEGLADITARDSLYQNVNQSL